MNMNQFNFRLLSLTGKLEIIFRENEEILSELKKLQNFATENDMINTAICFGRISKMAEYSNFECIEELNTLENILSSNEAENTYILAKSLSSEIANIPIEELELSPKAFNILKRAGINNLETLAKLNQRELQSIRNLGRKSFDEIMRNLSLLEST